MLTQLLRLVKLMMVVMIMVLTVTVGLLVLHHHDWETPSAASLPEKSRTPTTLVTAPTWAPKKIDKDLPSGPRGEKIRYGYDLVTETYKHLGPELDNPQQIYTGNNLACKNCHLESGTKASAASFVGVFQRFPQFRARKGGAGTLEERVNGCMERSMNGRKLAEDSPEMQAIVAYMQWLSEDVPEEELDHYRGFTSLELPDRAADTVAGRTIYEQRCAVCHSDDGLGQRVGETGDQAGYVYPPLWGADTYNHGAGMNRVTTAARFIKGNMPLGATAERPLLTDEEAYDVAAFINSHTRPLKENTEKDYPNLSLKPVDAPYGPYLDTFPASQHRFGPFGPLQEYYQNLKDTYVP
jgi:thiosulfate dehydrogenase